MSEKIIKVFYDQNGLPFKDKELQVHYPIVGSGFLGASNTTKIRFYYGALGTSDNVYSAVSKLPNGKTGNTILEKSSDSDGNYAELSLNYWYTQAKGDVYISLKVYRGGTTATWDEDSETYIVEGSPIIESTGAIKLSINYAPIGDYADYNDEYTTYEEIKAALGGKLNIEHGVYATSNINLLDMSLFEENQIFFDYTRKEFYKNVSGTAELILDIYDKDQIDDKLDGKVSRTYTPNQVYVTDSHGIPATLNYSKSTYRNNEVVVRGALGDISVPTTPSTNNSATSKEYVIGKFNDTGHSLALVSQPNYVYDIQLKDKDGNVLSYVTLDLPTESIIISGFYDDTTQSIILTLENGSTITIPVGDLVSGLVSTSDLTTALATKQDKIDSTHKLASDLVDDTNQTNKFVTASEKATWNAKQDALVSGTNIKTLNSTSLLGSGNYAFDIAFNESSTNALENKVIAKEFRELNYELAIIREELFEVVLTELDYTEDFATLYAIPTSISDTDGTHRVVYSETQLKTSSGNSVVVNQLVNLSDTNITLGTDKYLTYISGSWSVITGTGQTLSVSGGTDMVINLSQFDPSETNWTMDNPKVKWLLAQGYIAYNTGSLNSSVVSGIKIIGQNQWNEQWEEGTLDGLGQPYPNNSYFRSKDYCRLISSKQYYLTKGSNSVSFIYVYDKNKNLIDYYSFTEGRTLNAPSNGYWFKITGAQTTYSSGVMVCLYLGASTDYSYKPYTTHTISIPQSTLLGVGTAHDYLEVVEGDIIEGEQLYNVIKHTLMSSVDLGTLAWTGSGGIFSFYLASDNYGFAIKNLNQAGALQPKYRIGTSNSDDKSFRTNGGYIAIIDSSYSTTDALKSALNGVILQYELATPTQQTIETGLHFNEVSSLIEEGGSIEPIFTNVPPNSTTTFVVKKAVGE